MRESQFVKQVMRKEESVKAPEFIYELLKGGDKDFFTKKEVYNALKRSMGLSDNEKERERND